MTPRVEIADIVSRIDSWNPAQQSPDSEISYIDIASVNRETKQIEGVSIVLGKEAPSRARQLIKSGDVLVSTVRPNLNAVAFVPEDFDGATASTGYCVLRPKAEKSDGRYLFHWVKTQSFIDEMVKQATGASYPAVSDRIVKNSTIPLPPLPEQRRIAAILDKADAIRRKRQQAIRLTEDFLRSVFLDMFGDPVTNPKGWKTIKLGDLIEDGPQNGLYKPSSDYGSGTPIIRIDSFYDGVVTGVSNLKRVRLDKKSLEKYLAHKDNILINRVNSRKYLGKCAIVPELAEPTVFESNMMRFAVKKDELHPIYLVALLQHEYMRMQILNRAKDAVNQSSINQVDVNSFEVRVPPMELQMKFAGVKDKIFDIESVYAKAAGEKGALFNSLVQRAFRGNF